MQKFRQVSGGNCQLVLYRESSPGVLDAADKGVVLGTYDEDLAVDSNKQASSVISNARGQGKPVPGTPNYSGGINIPPYAPLLGHILRALCGAPATSAETAVDLADTAVVNLGRGYVSLAVEANPWVQDTVITIIGTANYDGAYRLEFGTDKTKLVIKCLYKPEVIPSTAKAYRGRAAFLKGPAADAGSGKVSLPVGGYGVPLHAGETVSLSGTVNYDGEHVLQPGTSTRSLVITAPYVAETFDGKPAAIPSFFRHEFALPKNQPTFTVQKKFDYQAGSSANPYTVATSNKLNGISFSFGGEAEIKLAIDLSVGGMENLPSPVSAETPALLPAIPFWDKEVAVWIDSSRAGEVQKGSVKFAYGIEGQVAAGDMGKRSRQTEGDPTYEINLTTFLEHDEYQQLSDMSVTVTASISMCGANGEEVWFTLPEAEVDAPSPKISGKGGLTADVKIIGFVDQSETSSKYILINRVASYA